MKYMRFVFAFLSPVMAVQAQQPNKVALIVAIANYKPDMGWNTLSSGNDTVLIKDALQRQGFLPANITVLSDAGATRDGILNAIRDKLINKVKPGDIAVFHYSGHGQQMEDDNNDEADGYDEALVPYDAPADYDAQTGFSKHLRDDQLGLALKKLREALGAKGNLLVILDACHSGTATRGQDLGTIYRGATKKYVSPNYKPGIKSANARVINEDIFGLGEAANTKLAPIVCFYAASSNQLNSETKLQDGTGVGSLSLAFSKAFANADTGFTYRALFEEIKVDMSNSVPGQTPQAEGDLDYTVMRGKALGKPLYFTCDKRLDSIGKTISILCGHVYGVFSGTKVKLYPRNTYNTESTTALDSGIVTAASEYSSEITLSKGLTADQLKAAWIYLTDINYGDLKISCSLRVADSELEKRLRALLATNKMATLVETKPDIIIEQGSNGIDPGAVFLVNAGAYKLDSIDKSVSDAQFNSFLNRRMADVARANYLRNLELKNKALKMTFQFVAVQYQKTGDTRAKLSELPLKKDVSGNIVFEDDDRFIFKINNPSDKRLYYALLDIQPDNKVNVLLPDGADNAGEFIIDPGVTLKLDKNIFVIGKPYGTDVIKLIASDKPLTNLKNMFDTGGTKTRGLEKTSNNPFEKMMQGVFETGTQARGASEVTMPPDQVNIYSVAYRILPAGSYKVAGTPPKTTPKK